MIIINECQNHLALGGIKLN